MADFVGALPDFRHKGQALPHSLAALNNVAVDLKCAAGRILHDRMVLFDRRGNLRNCRRQLLNGRRLLCCPLCEGLCSTGYLVRTTEHLLRSQLDTTHYRTQLLDKAFNGMLNGHEIALEGHVCLDGQIPLRKAAHDPVNLIDIAGKIPDTFPHGLGHFPDLIRSIVGDCDVQIAHAHFPQCIVELGDRAQPLYNDDP